MSAETRRLSSDSADEDARRDRRRPSHSQPDDGGPHESQRQGQRQDESQREIERALENDDRPESEDCPSLELSHQELDDMAEILCADPTDSTGQDAPGTLPTPTSSDIFGCEQVQPCPELQAHLDLRNVADMLFGQGRQLWNKGQTKPARKAFRDALDAAASALKCNMDLIDPEQMEFYEASSQQVRSTMAAIEAALHSTRAARTSNRQPQTHPPATNHQYQAHRDRHPHYYQSRRPSPLPHLQQQAAEPATAQQSAELMTAPISAAAFDLIPATNLADTVEPIQSGPDDQCPDFDFLRVDYPPQVKPILCV